MYLSSAVLVGLVIVTCEYSVYSAVIQEVSCKSFAYLLLIIAISTLQFCTNYIPCICSGVNGKRMKFIGDLLKDKGWSGVGLPN